MKRETLLSTLLIYSVLSSSPAWSADRLIHGHEIELGGFHEPHANITSGLAIVSPAVIERIVRQVIATQLGAQVNGARFQFQTKAIRQDIQIPEENVVLKEVLAALGIRKTLITTIAPIDVKFNLPMDGLNLKMKQAKPGLFDIVAKWNISKLSATSKKLNLHVPKGLFEKPFDIDSKPIQIGLTQNSPPIQVELKIQARMGESGTKLKLVSFNTNLTQTNPKVHPGFDFSIGPLSVDGQPLNLQIESNGRVLEASEGRIRQELEVLEPQFTASLRQEIEDQIQKYFNDTAATFEKASAFSMKLSTNSMVSKPEMNKAVSELIKGIDAEFNFESLEYNPKHDLFAARIASHICFDGQCLFNTQTSNIGEEDLKPLAKTSEVGMLIYESWLQRVINDDVFQKRIRKYYNSEAKSPGVDIGTAGVKIHLNPKTKSIDAVFNLSIDIKKTALSEDANTGWRKFWARRFKEFGDFVERTIGTGKFVVIPVEVQLNFVGFQLNAKGETEMVFKSTLPFKGDGTVTNTYKYPSNIDKLTGLVKKEFMDSVKESFEEIVPAEIRIPLSSGVAFQGMKLPLRQVTVTPHGGLLFTAEVPQAGVK